MSDNPVIPLSRFRADVSRALARRGQALLQSKDLAAEVAALTPLEAYFIVKELGVGDAAAILTKATTEQLQAFVDLDCWSEDTPDIAELEAWLAPFAAEGPEALAAAFLRLDEELQVCFLAGVLDVYDVRSDAVPEPASDAEQRMTTSDGFFVLVPKAPIDEERELNPLAFVDTLYRHDIEEAFRLLMAAKWESVAESEERAFQFRSARLTEMGFADPSEAAKLFAMPRAARRTAPTAKDEPGRAATSGVPRGESAPAVSESRPELPALYARPLSGGGLLSRALATVSEAKLLDRLERELVYVINTAIIGYGEAPRDVAHAAEIAERVRDTLSVGLEVLLSPAGPLAAAEAESAATVERAAALLAELPIADLFRIGHREVAQLQSAARALVADPVVRAWLDRAPEDAESAFGSVADRAFVKALIAPRPLFAGYDPQKPDKPRAFANRAEIAAAERRLDAIARAVT